MRVDFSNISFTSSYAFTQLLLILLADYSVGCRELEIRLEKQKATQNYIEEFLHKREEVHSLEY